MRVMNFRTVSGRCCDAGKAPSRSIAVLALYATLPCYVLATGASSLWHPYRITPRSGAQHLSLDGRWQLGHRDAAITSLQELKEVQWIDAVVPASLQWSLFRSGRLPHPYHNLNSKQYEWVDEKVWYYRRQFFTPAIAADTYAFLCFDGIDYYARVWLNGQLLGYHEGMFGGPSIEVSGLLRGQQSNELVVEVRAGNFGAKHRWKPTRMGKVIRPWIISRGNGAEHFFPIGIWQGVRLELVPRIHLERPFLVTRTATAQSAHLTLTVEVLSGRHSLEMQLHPPSHNILGNYRSGVTGKPVNEPLDLLIEMREKDTGRRALSERRRLALYEGCNWVRQEVRLLNPRLWCPNGMGRPNLYSVKLTLYRGGREVDELAFDYGVRVIETRPAAGVQTVPRWRDWQFVVNGRPLFVKGVNWTMVDVLLDAPKERYRWLLEMARAAGIQWIRANGAFLLETDTFHQLCDELGLMVEQEFPMGNQEYAEWPQDVWEAQVAQNIFRIRNHASVVLWSGGNEFNPYTPANTPIIGILERCLRLLDGTRPFLRSDPDEGAVHTYLDTDPCWYARVFREVPFLSEAGMHNIPEARSLREVIDPRELNGPFHNLFSPEFAAAHPELRHHFVEFNANRVPRMLSRASHVDNMSAPSLENLAEASQIGAGEFYQVISDGLQANYPVTTGLLPWVFQRPWPAVGIMLVDGFGQPTAPYYFLKRTYEQTHVAWVLPQLLWAHGEDVPADIRIMHGGTEAVPEARVSASVLDNYFESRWSRESTVSIKPGPSVASLELGSFRIPAELEGQFFFLLAELRGVDGKMLSRSVYWPRCLKDMADEPFRTKIRSSPQPWPPLDRGPWLKPQVEANRTTLALAVRRGTDAVIVRIRNTGRKPAFPVEINVEGAQRSFYADDNFFYLAPGEERELRLKIRWRSNPASPKINAKAWNAAIQEAGL